MGKSFGNGVIAFLGTAAIVAAGGVWTAEANGQSYVHRHHNLRVNTARPFGVAGASRVGIPRPATSLYLRNNLRGSHHGLYSRGRNLQRVYSPLHNHLHHHLHRARTVATHHRPTHHRLYSPVGYTYRYHRLPSHYYRYAGISPLYRSSLYRSSLHRSSLYRTSLFGSSFYGRTYSHWRRGPSVGFYFNTFPVYRRAHYYHSWRSYPLGRTYYYDSTLCYPYSYSGFRVSLRSPTVAPTLLLPPPRITLGESLISTIASVTPPSSLDPLDASLSLPATPTSGSLERLRATRETTAGDGYFAAGRYLEAVNSYAKAIERSPAESELMFRLGHALIAAGEYETAARSFKAAISLSPAADRGAFRLDELYGTAIADKAAHLENLSQYAIEKPRDANALFLIGVFLHFDGQSARARRFLTEAERLDPRNEAIQRMRAAATGLTGV